MQFSGFCEEKMERGIDQQRTVNLLWDNRQRSKRWKLCTWFIPSPPTPTLENVLSPVKKISFFQTLRQKLVANFKVLPGCPSPRRAIWKKKFIGWIDRFWRLVLYELFFNDAIFISSLCQSLLLFFGVCFIYIIIIINMLHLWCVSLSVVLKVLVIKVWAADDSLQSHWKYKYNNIITSSV